MKQTLLFIFTFLTFPSWSAQSDWIETDRLKARIITVENSIAPDIARLSAGIEIQLKDGWKTYWEFPGTIGLPPEMTPSDTALNIESLSLFYPTPERFSAFGIENYGYEKHVTYPFIIALQEAGRAAHLGINVNLLVCSNICVPETLKFDMVLKAGTDASDTHSSDIIARANETLPNLSTTPLFAHWSDGEFIISLKDIPTPVSAIFPHDAFGHEFSPPEIERTIARFTHKSLKTDPIPTKLTIETSKGAITYPVVAQNTPLLPQENWLALLSALLFALIGGLILNVMPCVLPVLSIKFAGALMASEKSLREIRLSFLASTAGIVSFMLFLAILVVMLRAFGQNFGFGVQFQSPIFLTSVFAILLLFTANLFGLFEFSLPPALMDRIDRKAGHYSGYLGDYATGLFAAILATPCSAPFMGTAITFALTGSILDTFVIFSGLGIGLATPYILVALSPKLLKALPRPGGWMMTVKYILGVGVFITSLWILSLLMAVLGVINAALIAVLLASALLIWLFKREKHTYITAVGVFLGVTSAFLISMVANAPIEVLDKNSDWQIFTKEAQQAAVERGEIVFIDVTANWCLTCKVNKATVLESDDIKAAFKLNNITLLRADWTRPNPEILSYLKENDRFGIPFNIIYGPKAVEGIILPELLTKATVFDALKNVQK